MIIYDRLWETMRKKQVTQYRLVKYYGFSSGQLGRLRKNRNVSTHTINILCRILDCAIHDIMEFKKDPDEDTVKPSRKPLKQICSNQTNVS